MSCADTIIAIATPPGHGGVGIVRVSGKNALTVCELITLKKNPDARIAYFCEFKSVDNSIIDEGLVIYFKGPNSFTGEDVIEFQCHGGPVILDRLLKTALTVNDVRLARAGEFTERAFLNDKIDLVQAEAIADLINASTEIAAKSAVRSLQGEFSKKINELLIKLTELRMYVEAAIDFPEEEIDFISDGKVLSDLQLILEKFYDIKQKAQLGSILQSGMKVVIAGKPNAGKSSLLNSLSGRDSAIVTEHAGTTRDILSEKINIDGMPLHVFDTAGLRDTDDEIEKIGIERAWNEFESADIILLVIDGEKEKLETLKNIWPEFFEKNIEAKLCVVINKIDLISEKARVEHIDQHDVIYISAKHQQGLELLKNHLKHIMGYHEQEDVFIARRRHLNALAITEKHLLLGKEHLEINQAGELLAEELKLAQHTLSEITGEFTSDDLLGKIFSSFCIGK